MMAAMIALTMFMLVLLLALDGSDESDEKGDGGLVSRAELGLTRVDLVALDEALEARVAGGILPLLFGFVGTLFFSFSAHCD